MRRRSGEVRGQDIQRAYFSDMPSLGNAHCTIWLALAKTKKLISPAYIWGISKWPSRERLSLCHAQLITRGPAAALEIGPKEKPPSLARLDGFPDMKGPIVRPAKTRLLEGRLAYRARIHRADESDDSPKVVAGLDDSAEWRHRTDHDLVLDAVVTLFLQLI